MSESAQPARTKSFAALRHPASRAYLAGTTLAMMADNIEHVISYWIMYQKFHSPELAGFAVISHWAPFLFFSVYAGALADRFDARRIIQVGQGLFMLVSVCWGLLFLTDTLEMWHAVVLLSLHGLAGVLWGPAGQMIIHDIAGPAQLQSSIRMLSTARHLGQLLGPAIGGGMLLALGPAWGIFANGLFYLPIMIWLCLVPYGSRKGVDTPPRAPRRGFSEIFETLRLISHDKLILTMILIGGFASLIVGNAYQAQMPEFAHDLVHDDADAGHSYSILLAANACGALLAGLVLESRGFLSARAGAVYVLVMLWCVAIAFFALTETYIVAVIALVVAGFLNLAYSAMTQTLVQTHSPHEIRGRVIGLYQMSSLGMRAFSGVFVGVVGGMIGVHWSLALSAMALLAVIVVMLSMTSWVNRLR